MRAPRVKVRSLMALVAIVALGCWALPRWWAWHHRMLRRSEWAARHGAAVEKLVNRPLPVARSYTIVRVHPDGQRERISSAELTQDYGQMACFPWFGLPCLYELDCAHTAP